MYTVKARYYADPDQFGESYIITSDNGDVDTNIEVGKKIAIVDASCEHELVSAKNEVITGGFVCVKCYKVFKEYSGDTVKVEVKYTPPKAPDEIELDIEGDPEYGND